MFKIMMFLKCSFLKSKRKREITMEIAFLHS
nr:MAG TPA: hypothetical protein [Caudoviricetes sp.]